jgi:phosphonate transport system substrate-binding protein
MPIKKTLRNSGNTDCRVFFAVLWLVLLTTACSQQQTTSSIDVLRVGILPDQDQAKLEKKYSLLFNYISKETNIPHKISYVNNYQELLDQFHEKKIDLALFGGVTFIKAHEKDGAIPLVLRDVDGQFRSIILVSSNHPAQTINDLKDSSFSFGPRLSTSGHYMPKHFLKEHDIDPEKFFSEINFSDAHDKTALWVRDGVVDAGVSNSGIVKDMFRSGTLSLDTTRILWETPPFYDYVWAVQSNGDKYFKNMIRNAFLKLTISNPEHKEILTALGAGYYIPADFNDFSTLAKSIRNSEMSDAS